MRLALREALRSLARGADRAAVVAVAVGVTFSLLGAFLVIDRNLSAAIRQARVGTKVVAYMEAGAGADRRETVAAAARALAGVADVRVASPEDSLEEFRAALGPENPIFEALDGNPLPGYVEVTPAVEDPAAIADALQRMEGVDEVDYGRRTVERLARIATTLRAAGLAVGAGLFLFALLLVATTEGLSAFVRRHEIDVFRLVGADDSLVLAPFWIEGAILGVAGAAVGLAVDYIAFQALVGRLPEISFRPVYLSAGTALLLLATGAAMGALGGLVAALRFLRAETR